LAIVARKDGELGGTARAIAGAEMNRRAASAYVRPVGRT
jgi:hypothetical protein